MSGGKCPGGYMSGGLCPRTINYTNVTTIVVCACS